MVNRATYRGVGLPESGSSEQKSKKALEWGDVQKTDTDGNCLFHAVSGALRDLATRDKLAKLKDALECRREAVRVLRGSPALRKQYGASAPYLAEMEQTARWSWDVERWGSDAEIDAMSRGSLAENEKGERIPIKIRVISAAYPDGFIEFGEGRLIVLFHAGRNHWEWVKPKGQPAGR